MFCFPLYILFSLFPQSQNLMSPVESLNQFVLLFFPVFIYYSKREKKMTLFEEEEKTCTKKKNSVKKIEQKKITKQKTEKLFF